MNGILLSENKRIVEQIFKACAAAAQTSILCTLWEQATQNCLEISNEELQDIKKNLPVKTCYDQLQETQKSIVKDLVLYPVMRLVHTHIYEVVCYIVYMKRYDIEIEKLQKLLDSNVLSKKEQRKLRSSFPSIEKRYLKECYEKSKEIWTAVEFEYFLNSY